jgi:hypothetical protein
VFSPGFVRRFAALAGAVTRLLVEETGEIPFLAPINEISFLAWAAGEMGYIYPFSLGRGDELKAQLVRAAIAGIASIRGAAPDARLCQIDSIFHVAADPARPADCTAAEAFRLAQFSAWDMLAARQLPGLGGRPDYLDIVGVNYYPWNQWTYVDSREAGPTIQRKDPWYRPLRQLLAEVYSRYGRPLFVAETGAEGEARVSWLRYVGREVRAACRSGVPLEGICLYPIVSFPGWDDGRHCQNGLWDYADPTGEREIYAPMASELRRQFRLSRTAGGQVGARGGA